MRKINFKYITISLLFVLSFFAFYKQTFAREVVTETTESYTIELVDGTIHPRRAIFEGKQNITEYSILKHLLDGSKTFKVEDSDYVCGKNDVSLGESEILTKENCNGIKNYNSSSDNMFYAKYSDLEVATKYFEDIKTISYTSKRKLENYILSGEECGSNGKGCVSISSTIDNPIIFHTFPLMNNKTIDTIQKEYNLKCGNNGYNSPKSVYAIPDSAKVHVNLVDAQGNVTEDIYNLDPYSDCKYSGNFYVLYKTVTKMSPSGNTNIYNNINALDIMSENSKTNNKVGDYVCVATYGTVNQTSTDLDDQVIIIDGLGTDKDKAMKTCEGIFNTDVADIGRVLINENKEIWTFALYKITESSNSQETMTVNKSSGGLRCEWSYTPDDGVTEKVGFGFGANLDSGKMNFTSIENIERLNVSIFLRPSDMKNILEQNKNIFDTFSNNISYDDQSGINWGFIASIAGAAVYIGANVAAAILTGGTSIVFSVIGTVAGATTVAFGIVTGIEGFSTYFGKQTGTYSIPDVWIGFPYIELKGNRVEGVLCSFEEFRDKFDIDSDYKVTCQGIFSGEFGRILSYILNILRIVGCILMVLLGIIDFVKPIMSGDAEMLQKSGTKFIKRIIIFILILFIPAIVKLLLSLIDKASCEL